MDTTNGFLTSSSIRCVLFSASISKIDPCFTAGKRIGSLRLSRNLRTPENNHLYIYSLCLPKNSETLFLEQLKTVFHPQQIQIVILDHQDGRTHAHEPRDGHAVPRLRRVRVRAVRHERRPVLLGPDAVPVSVAVRRDYRLRREFHQLRLLRLQRADRRLRRVGPFPRDSRGKSAPEGRPQPGEELDQLGRVALQGGGRGELVPRIYYR